MGAATTNINGSLQVAGRQPQGGRLLNYALTAAGTPGATQRATAQGTQAYFVVATAPVNARPLGGDFVTYSQGTGINAQNPFDWVELQNFQPYPIVVSIWVGFDNFIDRRLILANAQTPDVIYPTYPVPNAATFVNIVDLSGGAFKDVNGTQWLALYRKSILIFNLDTGNTYKLGGYSPTGADVGKYVAAISPAPLPIRLDIAGNYTYQTGGGNVNAIVSEVYSSILASSV